METTSQRRPFRIRLAELTSPKQGRLETCPYVSDTRLPGVKNRLDILFVEVVESWLAG